MSYQGVLFRLPLIISVAKLGSIVSRIFFGGEYLVFVSSCSVKMRGFSFLSLYKSLFIFQFLNVKMYNYGKQNIIVNFIIQKLKNKYKSLKNIETEKTEKAEEPLILTEREERRTRD